MYVISYCSCYRSWYIYTHVHPPTHVIQDLRHNHVLCNSDMSVLVMPRFVYIYIHEVEDTSANTMAVPLMTQ